MSLAVPWFVFSIVLVTRLPELLPVAPLLAGLPVALFGLSKRITTPVCAFYLGIIFALHAAHSGIDEAYPRQLENKVVEVEGTVVSLPVQGGGVQRFRFRVDSMPGCEVCWSGLVTLSWYRSSIVVNPGDELRLTVKLFSPRMTLNPGVFDYEGWLFFQGIRATGYVRDQGSFQRPDLSAFSGLQQAPHKYRSFLRDKILRLAEESPVKGLLVALTIGESGQISSSQWRSLTKTGTNHLFIISGLHVGLVAAMIFRALASLPIPIRWAGIFTVSLVGVYALIAGSGLPVQRALIMTTVVLVAVCVNRRMTLATMFSISLLGVVLMRPFAMMSTGFWLSFGAVFALLFAFAGRVDTDRQSSLWSLVMTAIKTQWVVFITMFPVLLTLVYQVSLIGFFINLIAIPFISLLVIPWLLLFVVASPVSDVMAEVTLTVSEFFLSLIWEVIVQAAELDWVVQNSGQGLYPICITIVGVYIFLVPGGLIPKWLALFCFLPILVVEDLPAEGELDLSFIDVGQGLSVLVRTRHSSLLYDAGAAFGDRFDNGEQTITPFLRQQGIKHLDTLIVSHSDNDHAGGAGAVERNFGPGRIFTPDTRSCDPGETWTMDGVRFEAFALDGVNLSSNDRSCLLLVTGSRFAVLLTGDIEALAEDALGEMTLPEMDIISMPHHGSRTSSTPRFINQVKADIAVVSAGYQNRFGHPHATVLRRYAARQVKVLNTAIEGAISFRLGEKGIKSIDTARSNGRRFWHRTRIKTKKKGKS